MPQRVSPPRPGPHPPTPIDYAVRAERELLAICMLDPERFIESSRVHPDDFVDHRNAVIFDVGLQLAKRARASGTKADYDELELELVRLGRLEAAGGRDYFIELSVLGLSPSRLPKLIDAIVEMSIRRGASAALVRHSRSLLDPTSPFDLTLDEARAVISTAARGRGSDAFPTLGSMADDLIETFRTPAANPGLPTGFGQLDEMIGGMRPGQLITIAGATGSGKTSLATQVALNAAFIASKNPGRFGAPDGQAAPVVVFSYEMTSDELYQRLVAQRSPVSDAFRPKRGWLSADLAIAEDGVRAIAPLPLIVVDDAPATVEFVRSAVERITLQHGSKPSLVVVDYIGLMTAPGLSNGVEVTSHITRSLKSMARELGIPVVALSQLNRDAGKRDDHRPKLVDLRQSGSVENDSNVVLLVYRESYYYAPERKRMAEANGAAVEITVAKNRAGETGSIHMTWIGRRYLFVPDASWVPAYGPSPLDHEAGIIDYPPITATGHAQTPEELVVQILTAHGAKCTRAAFDAAAGIGPKTKWGDSSIHKTVEGLVRNKRVLTATEGRTIVYWLADQVVPTLLPFGNGGHDNDNPEDVFGDAKLFAA